jgi:hypothetical protein
MACRRSAPALFFSLLLGAAAAARTAPGVSLNGTDGSRTDCAPPSRLLLATVEIETRTYEFAGACTVVRGDSTARVTYTIHAQWLPAEGLALEVIELRTAGSGRSRLSLKASCPDDPWLTGASCTLVSLLDAAGRPAAAVLGGPPIPKSAGRLPEATRLKLRKEAADLDSRPRPAVVQPADGATARDLVDVVFERPKGTPNEFPSLFEFRFEWLNPVTRKWVAQPVDRQYALTCEGRKTIPAALFINRGRYRLHARFAAPDRAKNPWSDWRIFTIPPRP